MAIIQSGSTSTLWTIDPTSTAGRITLYDQYGNAMSDVSSLSNILNALNSTVTIVLGGQATVGINVSGTTGTLTLSFEATIDNVTWFAVTMTPATGGATVTSTLANGQWVGSVSGYYAVRARISAFTSGSMTISVIVTPGQSKTGAQTIATAGALSVEITDGSADGPAAVKPASTAAIVTDPALVVAISPNNLVGITAASLPLPSGAATSANQTNGNQETQIVQGGNTATVTAASALKIDGSAVTQPISGTITANAGTGTFTVSGTVAATQSGSWTNTVTQATASNLRTQTSAESATASAPPVNAAYVGGLVTTAVESGLTNGDLYGLSLTTAGLLRIDGSNVTQPVSGTITANAGTGNFTVVQGTAANLNATVTGTIAATQSGTWTVQPGNTANTTPWLATINQGGNSATVTVSNALKVDGSAVTQPVSGTVTVNAGTGNFTNASIGPTASAPPADATYTGGLVTTATESGLTNNDMYPLSLTTTGLLRVDGSNVTQPISGTVTANAGTGNFTVVQSTASNLNATIIGTTAAGSGAATGLITIQGNASGTPVPISGTITSNIGTTNGLALDTSVNGILVAQGSTTSGEKGALVQAAVTTSAPGYTTGQTSPLSLTLAGALRIDGSAVTQPISGTVTANAGTGTFTVAGTVAATQSGTWTVQPGNTANTTPWLTTINQGGNSATVTASNALKIDGSAVTQPVSGTVTANAGTGTFAVSGTITSNQGATPWVDNITQFGGVALSTGTGASGTGIPRVTVSNDSNILVTQSGTWIDTVTQATAANLNATVTQGPANTPANSWSVEVTDGTNILGTQAHPLIIDTANDTTPATQNITAQDTSSTSTAVANSQNFITGSATAGSFATFTCSTDETIKIMVSGTWTGTITTEISLDAGTTWTATDVHQTGNPYVANSFTANFIGGLNVSGCTNFRVRATAAWTGTATIRIVVSDQTNSVYVANPTTLRDAVTQSNLATIKAASTQSLATDTALVVALAPGSAQTRASTSTVAGVASSASSVTILAANSARLGAIITNSSTALLYLKYASTAASIASGGYTVTVAISNGTHEVYGGYTGQITGIWASANGFANISELST